MTPRRDPRAGFASVGAGLLVCAALPPWGWWPLALAGVAVLDRLLVGRPGRSRLCRGALFGLGWFTPGLMWMWQLTVPGYFVAIVVFSAFVAIAALATPASPQYRRWVGLGAALTLTEAVRFSFPFGGVPLASLPMGQVGSAISGAATIGGVLLVTALTVFAGCGLSAAWQRRWGAAALLVFVPFAVGLEGVLVRRATTDHGESVTVAVVQGGGEQGTSATDSSAREVFERHLAATAEVPAGVDLVLWPENVIDLPPPAVFATSEQKDAVAAEAARIGAPILVGVTEDTADGENFINAQDVVLPDGTVADRYVKVRRVPFGEYLPFRSMIEAIEPSAGDSVPRDAVAGDGPATLDVPGVGRVGVAISWEIFFGSRARDGIGHGGQLLLNPTNGSSYTGTIVQTQQIASSSLRARETGRWVAQAAPTGFSAFVAPNGEVVQRSAVSEQRVMIERVQLNTGRTPYVRFGDLPWIALAAVALVGAWLVERRSQPSELEQDRDGAVVHQLDRHLGAESSGGDTSTEAP